MAGPRAVSAAADDMVMATNSSSTVSKRSVERFYFAHEPSFFRYFVSRLQRRPPLIHRGYFLRMHAVYTLVRNFLAAAPLPSPAHEPSTVVVNLGCGWDVLPWQCLERYPDLCCGACFVDVDFPALMQRKRSIVLDCPALRQPLIPVQACDDSPGPVILRSPRYCQIACDLRQLSVLEDALTTLFDRQRCRILFVAEVSITYMDTTAADDLIRWCSSFGQAEFCLLEQLAPAGTSHAFASIMLAHFSKLRCPLRSVETYPTLADQMRRFRLRGWECVRGWTLWEAWIDPFFFTASSRRALDDVEPFDEWEELALFAGHYCIIHAANHVALESPRQRDDSSVTPSSLSLSPTIPRLSVHMQPEEIVARPNPRCFGTAAECVDDLGRSFILHCFGAGPGGRVGSCDVYAPPDSPLDLLSPSFDGPPSRVCHTWTDVGHGRLLLAGGHQSPSAPRRDCWLFHSATQSWERATDLPLPLFRHSAARLARSSFALLVGGKMSQSEVFPGALLYHPRRGWITCDVSGGWTPVFGAVVACSGSSGASSFHGLLMGGMTESGEVADQILLWELDVAVDGKPTLHFKPCKFTADTSYKEWRAESRLLSRFGATWAIHGSILVLLGGVNSSGPLPSNDDVLLCSVSRHGCSVRARLSVDAPTSQSGTPCLFIGSSAVSTEAGGVVIVGGGTTCFNMSSFWMRGAISFRIPSPYMAAVLGDDKVNPVEPGPAYHKIASILLTSGSTSSSSIPAAETKISSREVAHIPRVRLETEEQFRQLVSRGQPVVFEQCLLGPCIERWSSAYIAGRVGEDRAVVIHDSSSEKMDFTAKNFRYETTTFGSLMRRVDAGERVYLRALSREEPAGSPAMLEADYPELAKDFLLPEQMALARDETFSSVLRISGKVNMWLHYDVMANIYCQVAGNKRLVLFPPSDITYLSFAPGASSSSANVFEADGSVAAIEHTHPCVANLDPGDVLFLPPLWPHASSAPSSKSIAVNVFFRNLGAAYSAGRDVYGNRDLSAYERGRQDIQKLLARFDGLPADVKDFYLRRLADEVARGTDT